jgi:DNA polymerase III subunit gamma/tau
MAFQVSARAWRPQKFSEVAGQEHITTTLKNSIKNKRIAHAFLFAGPRGVGKTTTARIFAKTLNCLHPVDFEPCNECEMCLSIKNFQSMDIIEIDGASNRGIDEIRTLRESVKYQPTKGKYKVYIIDEVHMLTKESFNAFLKTLEEPPEHTIFIFATTDVHKVPLTIISRCQRFDFRRIQLDTIKEQLLKIANDDKFKIEIDDKTLTIIAKKADGALRDAESLFDQVVAFCGQNIDYATVTKMLNLIDDDIYFAISDAILDKNFKSIFEVSSRIYDNGWNYIDFMDGLIEHFRNILTVAITKSAGLIESAEIYKTKYESYADKFSEGDLLRVLNYLTKFQQEIKSSQNQKVKIEIALCLLVGFEKTSTITELLKKLQNSDLSSLEEPESAVAAVKSRPTPPLAQTKIAEVEKEPESETANTVEEIKGRWGAFIKAVNAEKGLILGPIIMNLHLQRVEGNKIYASTQDGHAQIELEQNLDYLIDKTEGVFGKRFGFVFGVNGEAAPARSSSARTNASSANSNAPQSTGAATERASSGDPIIDSIENTLGGIELR